MNSAYFQPLTGREQEPHYSIASQPPAAWAGASLGLGWLGSRLALVWLAFLRIWANKFGLLSAGFLWISVGFGLISAGLGLDLASGLIWLDSGLA